MARLVADTHALVWRLTAPRTLGRGARRAFDAADSGRSLCLIPAIVFVELALLKERGRLGVGPADVLRACRGGPATPCWRSTPNRRSSSHRTRGSGTRWIASYSPLPASLAASC